MGRYRQFDDAVDVVNPRRKSAEFDARASYRPEENRAKSVQDEPPEGTALSASVPFGILQTGATFLQDLRGRQ